MNARFFFSMTAVPSEQLLASKKKKLFLDLTAPGFCSEVDTRQEDKMKKSPEERLRKELETFHQEGPKIQQQFSDLKRKLDEANTFLSLMFTQ